MQYEKMEEGSGIYTFGHNADSIAVGLSSPGSGWGKETGCIIYPRHTLAFKQLLNSYQW